MSLVMDKGVAYYITKQLIIIQRSTCESGETVLFFIFCLISIPSRTHRTVDFGMTSLCYLTDPSSSSI